MQIQDKAKRDILLLNRIKWFSVEIQTKDKFEQVEQLDWISCFIEKY